MEYPPVEGVSGGGTAYGWNDSFLEPRMKVVDVNKHPTSDVLHVWCMPSTATIGHQEPPRTLEQISLLVARNERESAQIALRPKVSWAGDGVSGHVQLHCADLISSDGNKLEVGKSLTLRRVVPVLGVPDALVPLTLPKPCVSLAPGETSALWISVDIPASQPPGVYEGEISIMAAESGYIQKDQMRNYIENIIAKGKEQYDAAAAVKSLQTICMELEHLLNFTTLSTTKSDHIENGKMDIDDEENNNSNFCCSSPLAIKVKLNVTVWDFVLPITPSIPAVFGISETVIEDRFGLEHGSSEWYASLDMHFEWLLQYRISPFFCRWGNNMRILAYTCPWPADHPNAEAYYSNPRLAAYAVPYAPVISGSTYNETVKREIEILKSKVHWKKNYFYLWDEPLSWEQYNSIRNMAEGIKSIAPDARILTTYYCGPSDGSVPAGTFESFLKVPSYLRPHTQIFCTSEWVLGSREDLVKDIVAQIQPSNSEEWWTYVCMGPSDPYPNWHLGMRGTQHRAVMWRVWKEGGSGFLYWGANCYEKALSPSAEVRFRRGLPPGDGVLYYPGQVFNPDCIQPVASIRLERILSGLQDIEYLKLYSSRYGRDDAKSLIERSGMYVGPERYSEDDGGIEAMRSQVYHSCTTQNR